jgi:sugar phosphate isomerase/epimerase
MLYGAMNSPLRPVLQELEEIARLGFDYLELTMDPPCAHYSVIRGSRQDLLKGLDRLGMGLVIHLPTFVSTADLTESLREASVQETLLSLREASELQPLKAVLHPSFIQGLGAMARDQARQYADRALERVLEEAERLSLPVCVENLFPRSLSLKSPEDFEPVFRKYPAARLALDTGHANIGEGGTERIISFIAVHGSRIGHIHASDNSGRDDEHLPVGAGSIDFPRVVRKLRDAGYDGTITLEVFSRDRDYLRISREKLAAMFAGCADK